MIENGRQLRLVETGTSKLAQRDTHSASDEESSG